MIRVHLLGQRRHSPFLKCLVYIHCHHFLPPTYSSAQGNLLPKHCFWQAQQRPPYCQMWGHPPAPWKHSLRLVNMPCLTHVCAVASRILHFPAFFYFSFIISSFSAHPFSDGVSKTPLYSWLISSCVSPRKLHPHTHAVKPKSVSTLTSGEIHRLLFAYEGWVSCAPTRNLLSITKFQEFGGPLGRTGKKGSGGFGLGPEVWGKRRNRRLVVGVEALEIWL